MSTSLTRTATIVLAKRDTKKFEEALGTIPEVENLKILSEGKAFECSVPSQLNQVNMSETFQANDIQADICIEPIGDRKKKLLICDMDSTLIGQECIDELADFAGVKDRVSAITERAMRGEIGFEGALTERVSLLKNLDISVLESVLRNALL